MLNTHNKEITSCPICDNSSTEFYVAKNNYPFNRCKKCDFVFLHPMPNQNTLNEQYENTNDSELFEPTYNKSSSRLRRAFIKLPRFFPYAFNKNTLDLGCGGGFIAHVLSLVAKSSTGIDISKKSIKYAKSRFKKASYIYSDFVSLLKTTKKYDFIYSSEVIEHVSDVNLYMKTLAHLIKKGGYTYITTPDIGHPKVPQNILDWDVFWPPIHVQHFNKKTVSVLFEKYGFKIIKFYKNKKPGLIFLSKKL